jgi:hypothetical protein
MSTKRLIMPVILGGYSKDMEGYVSDIFYIIDLRSEKLPDAAEASWPRVEFETYKILSSSLCDFRRGLDW